jgi:hypothetical protein
MESPASRMDLERVLPAVYALLALAATGRSGVQLATEASRAPVAYTLSAVAGLVYIAGFVALSRAEQSRRALRWAMTLCVIELGGVIGVGLFSLLDSLQFPDDTVWSRFGAGYGYIPLALPVVALLWLRRAAHRRPASRPSAGRHVTSVRGGERDQA